MYIGRSPHSAACDRWPIHNCKFMNAFYATRAPALSPKNMAATSVSCWWPESRPCLRGEGVRRGATSKLMRQVSIEGCTCVGYPSVPTRDMRYPRLAPTAYTSAQLLPCLMSTLNGTDRSAADSISSTTNLRSVSNSIGGTSKINSSWICSNMRLLC